MQIAIGRDQTIWLKAQSAKGTAVWPAATDAVLVTGDAKFKQDPYFNKDKQKINTLGETGRLKGKIKPGEFSFPTYIRASGSLGVAPSPGPALKSLCGKETIAAGASVTYAQYIRGEEPVYLSVLLRDNYETVLIQDAVVFKGRLQVLADGGDDDWVGMEFSGGFLKCLVAGTDATGQLEAINATAIHAVNAKKFDVGQKIIVGTSGVTSGHLITARDLATDILTIAATGLESEQASGVTIRGWTPSVTVSGHLMLGCFGKYQEKLPGGAFADVVIIEAGIEIENGWVVADNVKNDDDYPYDFKNPGNRVIPVTVKRYVQTDGGVYRYEAHNQTAKELNIPAANNTWATSAGKRMKVVVNNFQFDNPEASGDAERIYGLVGKAFETAALNDAYTILFD